MPALVKQKALDDVLTQKQFYEQNLGVKLIAVGFRDATVGQGPTPGARVVEEVVVTGIRSTVSKEVGGYAQNEAPSFDEVEYKARVSVDFRVETQSE